ncbi:hypothetical protein COCNU_11G006830 [Cocos nucifera]|uniref:Uncharacterized protein n=1 Tax=Cocos nucifera TaxID=13894 RepID=A0A8K0IP58_COCNU|nr:hypothetical protein COCNU_11G006830 [Cocos nucifera]
MDGPDLAVDDRTFKVNFTTEGVSKLRDRVKEKLKEFMGDYTDDTLVAYDLQTLIKMETLEIECICDYDNGSTLDAMVPIDCIT